MRFSVLISALATLLSTGVTASVIHSKLVERGALSSSSQAARSSSIDPASLLIGACLAVGTCFYGENQQDCYTSGCLEDNLGGICSCVPEVQSVIELQTMKGKQEWPVKCPYR